MDVVEIRVRGVGGETATEILEGPVRQVDGDADAGFYEADPPENAEGVHSVEAYEWGRLTSGSAQSALWWILLPFSLLNLAGWMFRPTPEDREPRGRSALWWARLVIVIGGLALTFLFLTWLAHIVVDVVALSCGDPNLLVGDSEIACADRGVLKILQLQSGHPLWQATVGFSAVVLVWFALLGQVQRSQRLEWFERDPARRLAQGLGLGNGAASAEDWTPSRLTRDTELEDWSFWYQWAEYRRLWRSHLFATASAFGLIIGGGLAVLNQHPRWAGGPADATWAWSSSVVATVVFSGFWYVAKADRFPDGEPRRRVHSGFRYAVLYAGSTAVFAIGAFLMVQHRAFEYRQPIGFGDLLELLTVGVYVLMILLCVFLIRIRCRKGAWKHSGFRYGGPLITGGLAFLVLGAGMGGLTYVIGRGVLGSTRLSQLDVETAFPETLAVAILVVALFAVVGMLAEWFRRRRRDRVAKVLKEYFPGDGPRFTRDKAWAKSVAGKRSRSELGRQIDHQLLILFVVVVLVQVIQGIIYFKTDRRVDFGSPLFGLQWLDFLHGFAATAIVIFLFPGLQVMRLMFKSRTSRRQFGKVWDVVSFWPRRFHPFAAPCYAEKAVPGLRDRVMHHLAKRRGVIICAHSQGSVIAFAALQQIRAEATGLAAFRSALADTPDQGELVERYLNDLNVEGDEMARSGQLDHVALITYGSPLSQLYGRFFPQHFGTESRFADLKNLLAPGPHGWRNFYRPTDYIGKEVFVPPGGVLVPESEIADTELFESTYPASGLRARFFPPLSHSEYWREGAVKLWLAAVVENFRSPKPKKRQRKR